MTEDTQSARAIRIKDTMSSPGWVFDVEPILRELAQDDLEKLVTMIDSRPDELTGKKAIRLASHRRGLLDLLEKLNDEVRINLPQTANGGNNP